MSDEPTNIEGTITPAEFALGMIANGSHVAVVVPVDPDTCTVAICGTTFSPETLDAFAAMDLDDVFRAIVLTGIEQARRARRCNGLPL